MAPCRKRRRNSSAFPVGTDSGADSAQPGRRILTTSEHQSYYAADVESLTEQVLGWRLPLMGLQYWVQGMNSPARQLRWTWMLMGVWWLSGRMDGKIDYASYFPASADARQRRISAVAAAKLLMLKRGDLQIKLVIDTWSSVGN